MRKLFLTLLTISLSFTLISCGEEIDVVESGTYEGVVAKVVPEEEEIYVNLDDGKKIELYFKENTLLMRDTLEVPFSELAVDQRISVEVLKVGKRLDPIKVEIIE